MSDILNVKIIKDKSPVETLEMIAKLVNILYLGMMAWQVAKMVMPQLEVEEKIFIAKLQKKFGKKKEPTDDMAEEFVSQVTRYVRDEDYRNEMFKRPIIEEPNMMAVA